MARHDELRVFISSTFTDLEDERQHLAKKVFPAIRQLCRERGIEFTEIDLRWGLTEEEVRLGKVIRTCMEEIDRCRPYFVGLIGSRYGWIPEFHEVQRDAELLRRYPWIEDAVLEEKSLVEMEFEYGALANPAEAPHSLFYTRRARAQHQNVFAHTTHHEAEKIIALKERILKSGLPLRDFSGPESLGELIYDDLVSIIEDQWKPKEELSPLERERREHEGFASSRRHAYIANPAYLRKLGDAAREQKPLVVYAPSGSGKSALLAYWAKSVRERMPDRFVIEHYTGIGSAADESGLLTHLFGEIKERLSLDEPIPTEPAQLVSEFPAWFARLGDLQTIIVIDALDQLDERAQHLDWLPEHLPENVTIIASTTSREMCDTLSARGYDMLELTPLSNAEREAITVRFLSEFHKALDRDDLERIASDPKCASPLFLRTMLEEIRVSANFKHLDNFIERYLATRDTDELFQRVLERLEEDYGSRTVREVMGLIWASRAGLAENELASLMPITRMRLSSFLMALDFHLHRRNGSLTFFHEYLRRAVEARYASTEAKQKHLHEMIARSTREQKPSDRRAEEEPWQWEKAGNKAELSATLTDPDLLPYLLDKERRYRTFGYWRTTLEEHDLVKEYNALLLKGRSDLGKKDFIRSLDLVANFYVAAGKFNAAKPLFEELIALTKQMYGSESDETAHILDDYGTMLHDNREFAEAEAAFRTSVIIFESHYGSESKEVVNSLSNLGAALFGRGMYQEAEKIFRDALTLSERLYGNGHQLVAENLNNLAMSVLELGKGEEAIELNLRSLAINKFIYGEMNLRTALNYENLGVTYRRLGQLENAVAMLTQSVEINKALVGSSHIATLNAIFNLAWALHELKRYEESTRYYEHVIREIEANLAPNFILLLHAYNNLANVINLWKGIESARPYYEECIRRSAAANPEFAKDFAKRWLPRISQVGKENLRDGFIAFLEDYNISID